MTAERVYKTAMTHTEAQAELLRCCGSQFDPTVVHAFATALAREQCERRAEASPRPSPQRPSTNRSSSSAAVEGPSCAAAQRASSPARSE